MCARSQAAAAKKARAVRTLGRDLPAAASAVRDPRTAADRHLAADPSKRRRPEAAQQIDIGFKLDTVRARFPCRAGDGDAGDWVEGVAMGQAWRAQRPPARWSAPVALAALLVGAGLSVAGDPDDDGLFDAVPVSPPTATQVAPEVVATAPLALEPPAVEVAPTTVAEAPPPAAPAADPASAPPPAEAPSAPPGTVLMPTVKAPPPDVQVAAVKVIANFMDQIDVPAGQSVIVRLNRPAERVSIADPEVADVVLVGPEEILVNGRGRRYTAHSGETVVQEAQTSLVVWDKQGRADVRALYVNRSRTEQIELGVTVAELNRSALENQGFDFQIFQNKVFFTATPTKLIAPGQLNTSLMSPNPGGTATFQNNPSVRNDLVTFSVIDLNNNFLAFIELLQRESLAKILARPTLLARSGEDAHFRAGGEVPIPLVTNNQLAVQFKEFGVLVNFTPNFTDAGGIDLKVAAELSEVDPTIAVSLGGIGVPGFKSRQVSTRVRLRDSQSLLIGGLLRDDEVEQEEKVPYLGDVPYLGAFFRTTHFEHKRTELLILVSPHVVKADRDDNDMVLPSSRPPFTRTEVRTKPTPNPVSRPRLFGRHRDRVSGDPPPPVGVGNGP